MRKYFFVWSILFCSLTIKANHIVGGEIEFITEAPGLYRLNLIQYRDETQTNNPDPENSEPMLVISLFSNKDNRLVRDFIISYLGQEPVQYTNIDCQIAELQTNKVVWTALLELDPFEFADEEGYYFAWERCCRNDDILNIRNPLGTGMKYVLDIPPLVKNDRVYVNSSPILNPPLRDYGCVGQFYYTSFTGFDPDGDSLVYRLANPLNSSTSDALPITRPKPNIEVRWAGGFSLNEQIRGNPPLSISNKGLLTLEPSEVGLFVFSIIVEEWRFDNEANQSLKIGQTQRDFQMLVLDNCNPPPPPILTINSPDNPSFDPAKDTLIYGSGDEKCFNFSVANIREGENVSFRASPVNFEGEFDVLDNIKFTVGENDELMVEFCVPDCPPIVGRPYIVDFIVADDICPLPQLDSVRVAIQVAPPPNINVEITPVLGDPFFVNNGDQISFNFRATDADADIIDLAFLFNDPLPLEERGMVFNITNQVPGLVEGNFTWTVDCTIYDYSDKSSFQVGIKAEDGDQCMYENPFVEWFSLNAILPGNTDPVVSTNAATQIVIEPGDEIDFDVLVNDLDGDSVNLRMIGDGFDPAQFGVRFQDTVGVGPLAGNFNWMTICEEINLLAKNDFRFLFIADDIDICNLKNVDTLIVDVKINLPSNNNPEISFPQRSYTIGINREFELELFATDADDDQITLQFDDSFRRPVSPSLSFETVTGSGTVSSVLRWTPECRLLPIGRPSANYDLHFVAFDNSCPITGFDTLKISFEVIEFREEFERFVPPNVFTPNRDGVNDTFTLTGQADAKRNLPPDNCEDSFDYIIIQDRTGKPVFESSRRDFVWDGGSNPFGTYYYFIKYTQTEFKGIVTLFR